MKELQHLTVILSDEHEGKARIVNTDNENENILVDISYSKKSGDTRINIDLELFKQKRQPLPAELFEREINITEEQRIELYEALGQTKAIMIKDIALKLGIERNDAIVIINLAYTYGLLTRGHNNTWKVIDDTIQKRWLEEAARLRRGDTEMRGMPSYEESKDKLQKQGFEIGNKKIPNIKESIIKVKGGEGHNSKVAREESSILESPVEIISEEPLLGVDKPISGLVMMKARLKELETIIKDTSRNDIHERIKERSNLQVSIRNVELQQSKYCSNTGMKMNESGSIVNITQKSGVVLPIKRVIALQGVSSKQITTKGKPSPSKGVRKP